LKISYVHNTARSKTGTPDFEAIEIVVP